MSYTEATYPELKGRATIGTLSSMMTSSNPSDALGSSLAVNGPESLCSVFGESSTSRRRKRNNKNSHEELFDCGKDFPRQKRDVDYVDDPNALSENFTCPEDLCLPNQCSFDDVPGNWYGNTVTYRLADTKIKRWCHVGNPNVALSYEESDSMCDSKKASIYKSFDIDKIDDFKYLLEELKWPKNRTFWMNIHDSEDKTIIRISGAYDDYSFVNESRDVPNPPYDCFFTSIARNYSLQSTPCSSTDFCFKSDIEFQGGEILSTSIIWLSPEECHSHCQNYTNCTAFTWYGENVTNTSMALTCKLWSNNSPTFKWVAALDVVSGPRNCTYDTEQYNTSNPDYQGHAVICRRRWCPPEGCNPTTTSTTSIPSSTTQQQQQQEQQQNQQQQSSSTQPSTSTATVTTSFSTISTEQESTTTPATTSLISTEQESITSTTVTTSSLTEQESTNTPVTTCLLYTSDAADE